ncbi:MAG: RNA polymerase sigma factor [Kofleriaceae bacterium]|nr:RNA polymerase sigma factor [Myxococcales bacterium]MCB9564224.1 RNA polymerase sigma factor [Kofleriaceae bacterium]
MTDTSLDTLSGALRASWQQFLDVYEPLRPQLYRYCRHLTRSPWDAEDLAQDTMVRAFATLGRMGAAPPNPRAWLFRVASNLWIDRVRRSRETPHPAEELPAGTATPEPRAHREAVGTLVAQLSPQERAAVVLKDVFELSLDEVAEALSTSVGAVKAALHRGRGKLVEPDLAEPRAAVPAVIDAFCDAFNARDVSRLTALLLDTTAVEVVGASTEYGRRGRILDGMLFGSAVMAEAHTHGGAQAELFRGVLPDPPRSELRVHRGEPLLLVWYAHADGDAVRAINRLEVDGDRIVAVRNYFYSPDFLREACEELGVPWRSNGYRWWPHCPKPDPGA